MLPHTILSDVANGGLYRFNILKSPRESSISCDSLKWRKVFQFQFPRVHSTERLEIENSASGWYRNIPKYGSGNRHDVTWCDRICFIETVKRGEPQREIEFVLLREIYFLKADIDFRYLYFCIQLQLILFSNEKFSPLKLFLPILFLIILITISSWWKLKFYQFYHFFCHIIVTIFIKLNDKHLTTILVWNIRLFLAFTILFSSYDRSLLFNSMICILFAVQRAVYFLKTGE